MSYHIIDKGFHETWGTLFPHLVPQIKESGNTLSVKTISFLVTENCNLRCTYCYEHGKNKTRVMTKDVAKKAIDLILDDTRMNGYINSKDTPCIIIEFMGGEPLLEIELMDYIADYFRYRAFELNHPWAVHHMFNFSSNGVLFETDAIQKFLNKNKGRLAFGITIDGDRELHDACRIFPNGAGSYDIVQSSIKNAVKYHGLRNTKVTFAPENIPFISQSIPHLIDLGLTDIFANCVFEEGWTWKDAQVFYKQLCLLADYIIDNNVFEYAAISIFDETIGKPMNPENLQNFCGGNGSMLGIATDGKLYPCTRFMPFCLANKNLPEFTIGDVDTGLLSESKCEKLQCLKCVDRRTQSTDECFNCPIAQGCAWCTAYHYDKFEDPNKRATYICCMHKARVLANHYYWNKLYKKLDIDKVFPLNLTQEDAKKITEAF